MNLRLHILIEKSANDNGFEALKNKEMREFGEYRTQRLVLGAWDRLTGYESKFIPQGVIA